MPASSVRRLAAATGSVPARPFSSLLWVRAACLCLLVAAPAQRARGPKPPRAGKAFGGDVRRDPGTPVVADADGNDVTRIDLPDEDGRRRRDAAARVLAPRSR